MMGTGYTQMRNGITKALVDKELIEIRSYRSRSEQPIVISSLFVNQFCISAHSYFNTALQQQQQQQLQPRQPQLPSAERNTNKRMFGGNFC